MSETSFPSLWVTASGFSAQGAFAQAQADFLEPDAAEVARLRALLEAKQTGVVAHFYMDPELQGVLSACEYPHIHISDSLVMADRAVEMAKAGAKRVVVLGVDFMSENVRALLDDAGYEDVPVYRVAEADIGCSLAESAEAKAYGAYLHRAAQAQNPLHVVYINTSLRTKAKAQALLPTITCTSSNVVQTILQAAAQVPDVSIFFGPDTYMGQNLKELFEGLVALGDDAIRRLHPAHDRASVQSLLSRFHYFEQGNCVVHHMFGDDVVRRLRTEHADADVTAHLEVPGEMFRLGLEAQSRGHGVVGSTSNILNFITDRVTQEATRADGAQRLKFVLGTETGMTTAVVRRVQDVLRAHPGRNLGVEIIFPVASEAIAQTSDPALPIIPGVAAGEGCSTEGGCATCPFMKMNSLNALFDVLEVIDSPEPSHLKGFHPRVYSERIGGQTAAALGGLPILHMRGFQQAGELPAALVADVKTPRPAADGVW